MRLGEGLPSGASVAMPSSPGRTWQGQIFWLGGKPAGLSKVHPKHPTVHIFIIRCPKVVDRSTGHERSGNFVTESGPSGLHFKINMRERERQREQQRKGEGERNGGVGMGEREGGREREGETEGEREMLVQRKFAFHQNTRPRLGRRWTPCSPRNHLPRFCLAAKIFQSK